MAKFLQETTEWKDTAPNHLYVMDDSKERMLAYRPAGKSEFMTFKKPIRIDTRGRKFTEVKNTFGFKLEEEVPEGKAHKVIGSKGELYTVTELRGEFSCTCSGFKFRGKCKHSEMIKDKMV
jgi:hypothetical protein